jgi:hypothetical protein
MRAATFHEEGLSYTDFLQLRGMIWLVQGAVKGLGQINVKCNEQLRVFLELREKGDFFARFARSRLGLGKEKTFPLNF